MKAKERKDAPKRAKAPVRRRGANHTKKGTPRQLADFRTGTVGLGLAQPELQLLELLVEEKIIRQDRFWALLGTPQEQVDKFVDHLEERALVTRQKFLYDDPAPWVWLTNSGCTLACYSAFPARFYEPAIGQLEHRDEVLKARIHYLREYPEGKWLCERGMQVRFADSNWRLRLADGLVEVPTRRDGVKSIVVEIDVTIKTPFEFGKRLKALCGNELYDEVHYRCDPAFKPAVEAAKERLASKGFDMSRLEILDLARPEGLV